MKTFFEMSFEEHLASSLVRKPVAQALGDWVAQGVALWEAIKKSDHYHGGMTCAQAHKLEDGREIVMSDLDGELGHRSA